MRLALLLLLFCGNAWAATGSAAVDTFYVRPKADCANNGDGLSFACAAGNGQAGAWRGMGGIIYTTTTGLDDGDTLYLCGNFIYEDADGASNYIQFDATGAGGVYVTLDGDCSAQMTNPANWTDKAGTAHSGARLYGGDVASHGIRTMANSYIKIQNLEMYGMDVASISLYTATTEKTDPKYITIDNVWLHDNISIDEGDADSMIAGYGTNITVTDSIVENAPGDGIFINGANATLTGNRVANVGTGTSIEGDCIQYTENLNGGLVDDNSCYHTSYAEKQCYLMNAEAGDNGAFTFTDNTCEGYTSAATPGACVYLGSTGAWKAHRNFVTGCDYSYNIAEMGATSKFSGNIGIGAALVGLRVGSLVDAANIYNNSMAGSVGIGIQSDTAGAVIVFKNNAVLGYPTCMDMLDTDNVEQYNSCFGYTTAKTINGGAGTLDASDLTVTQGFVVGSPTTAAGFKLTGSSALRRAGVDLGIGNVQDYGNHAFLRPPSIGAWESRRAYNRTHR